MKLTTSQIAQITQGQMEGSPDIPIEGVAGLDEAGSGDLSFLGNPKYLSKLKDTKAGCLLLPASLAGGPKGLPEHDYTGCRIYVSNPPWALTQILRILEKEKKNHVANIHPAAVIHPTAKLAPDVSIGACCVVEEGAEIGPKTVLYPQCYIGKNARIGSQCLIYPQVVVREECHIGDRCILHSGTVIGGDGYGYVYENGCHQKIPQLGRVVLEEDVETGANVTIDRATMGETRIGAGTKIDNLVQIGHNVQIGKHCLIVAQVGIAGSTRIGNGVTLAGQVGVAGHITLGDGTIVSAQSGIMGDTPPKSVWFGSPARPHRESLKLQVLYGKLPEMAESIKAIKKTLKIQDPVH